MVVKTKGRPLKYRYIIRELDPLTLYTPAAIARFALKHGLLVKDANTKSNLAYRRVRITLGRFTNNRKFPDEGDGAVTLQGQPPNPGWFGWRWQKAMGFDVSNVQL